MVRLPQTCPPLRAAERAVVHGAARHERDQRGREHEQAGDVQRRQRVAHGRAREREPRGEREERAEEVRERVEPLDEDQVAGDVEHEARVRGRGRLPQRAHARPVGRVVRHVDVAQVRQLRAAQHVRELARGRGRDADRAQRHALQRGRRRGDGREQRRGRARGERNVREGEVQQRVRAGQEVGEEGQVRGREVPRVQGERGVLAAQQRQ